eukprot:Skav212185  [mRNA]  locus=scaffold754:506059:510096:- [translate_table: standard]
MGVEPSVAYECRHPEHYKEVKQLVLQLRCKRGVSEKFIKASAISSGTIEAPSLRERIPFFHCSVGNGVLWFSGCRIDPEIYLDSLQDRAEQVSKTDEERAQSMGMLKMYQELLRQAKGLNGVA